jgi:replication factor C small subunit
MNVLTEKYRPEKREDIVGNKETIDKIFSVVNSGKLCHMIFEGIAGSGKTSTAKAIAKQLFGTNIKMNYLELNASDERGIETVQEKIKMFAKVVPFQTGVKLILLDEGDEMTATAQNALRGIMEQYANICIFIFTANNAERLIEPIRSRCEVFHFGPISTDDMIVRLTKIYEDERKIPITSVPSLEEQLALRKIAEYSQGDMRRALNHLQVLLSSGEPLSEASVDTIKPIDFGKMIFDALQAGRFLEARSHVFKALELGYDARNLLSLCHKVYIASDVDISTMKIAIISLSECDYRMTQGVDKVLALDAVLLRLMK